MIPKNKLTNFLSSKAATTSSKFVYRSKEIRNSAQPRKFNGVEQSPQYNQNLSPAGSQNYRRRNHTQNGKYIGRSIATLDLKGKINNEKRYSLINNSKSLNLRSEKQLYRSVENNKDSLNKQDRLLLMREEKLGRLKNMYAMRNKLSLQNDKKHPKLSNYNPRFNSFQQIQKKHSSQVIRHQNSKEKILFHKKQNFHYSPKNKQNSQRKIPKFFDYCQSVDRRQNRNHQAQLSYQHQMPQVIKNDHIIGKVASLKHFIETPPLIPITFKKQQQFAPDQLSLQWLKGSYEPHLEIFQKLSMDKFSMKKINKGVYFGEIKQQGGLPQGKGFIFYKNGKIFQGHFKNGQKQGLGYQNYPDQSHYLGYFVNGRRDGKGKFQWSNGEIYDGQWKNNKKQGSGIWKGSNNLSYVGEWHQDSIEGFGVLIDKETRYEGEFKHFMKWGNGTIRFQNGQTYTGSFKQNLPNGVGDYYWSNSDYYHGQFANGKRHGEGMLKYSNGGIYRGHFQNDKKSGRGQQYYEDNLYYEGEFQNDFRHGWGILYCNGNAIFEGYWLNNSAVDQKNGRIEPIIEQEQSVYENDTSKNSKIKKHQSNISLLRNRNKARKQDNFVYRNSKSNDKQGEASLAKPFRRACNCERHRKQNLQTST